MSTAARPRLKHSFIALVLALVVGALFIPLASSPAYAVENDGSKVQLQAQSLNVEPNAISAAPSNNITMYEVYSTYLFFSTGMNFYGDTRICMAIRPAGGSWSYYGGMMYLQQYTINGLIPNTWYEAKLYYRHIWSGQTGPYSGSVFFKTGPNALPKVKSVKVQAVKVKKKRTWYYGPYTGLPLYKYSYYSYKIKTTVKFKKKPGTPYLYVNGKRFKGNKKTYTYTTGNLSSLKKPRGQKYTVYVYTGLDATYGGYSLLYQKNFKVK